MSDEIRTEDEPDVEAHSNTFGSNTVGAADDEPDVEAHSNTVGSNTVGSNTVA